MTRDTKSHAGKLTLELPGLPGRPGRPLSPAAKSHKQRTREYRARKAEELRQQTDTLADVPTPTLAHRLANHLIAHHNGNPSELDEEAEDYALAEWKTIGHRMGWR